MNPFLVATLSIGLDYGSTKYALSQGAIESNPILHQNMEMVKIAETIAIGTGLQILEKRNKRAAKITKVGLFIINGIIAGINIRNGMKAK